MPRDMMYGLLVEERVEENVRGFIVGAGVILDETGKVTYLRSPRMLAPRYFRNSPGTSDAAEWLNERYFETIAGYAERTACNWGSTIQGALPPADNGDGAPWATNGQGVPDVVLDVPREIVGRFPSRFVYVEREPAGLAPSQELWAGVMPEGDDAD